jgi:hypothetical protein
MVTITSSSEIHCILANSKLNNKVKIKVQGSGLFPERNRALSRSDSKAFRSPTNQNKKERKRQTKEGRNMPVSFTII